MAKIIRSIKKIFKCYIFKKQSLNDFYIDVYRASGMKIGKNCSINSILPCGRDSFLIEIGDNVTISTNCYLLPHDASIGNATNYEVTDLLGKIKIGNNCFVGNSSIILPGVSLAEHTIVGAGSVVTKSIETKGIVIAGNPATYICTLDEYLKRNKDNAFQLHGLSDKDVKLLVERNKNKLITKHSINITKHSNKDG